MKDYVYDFSWGYSKKIEEFNDYYKARLPKDRVFITHDPTSTGH